MRRGLVVGGAVALIVTAGLVAAWPFWTARQIQKHANANDTDSLQAYLDQPAIEEDMQQRLSAEVLAEEGLGALGEMMADRAVQGVASPYGMARIIAHGYISAPAPGEDPGPELTYRAGYVSPNRFRIRTHDPKAKVDGPSFLLGRQNLVQWKIIKVEPAARRADQ